MSDTTIDSLQAGLRELMNHVSPAEFDHILQVQEDLEAWSENGGEMPHEEQLRAWGLLDGAATVPEEVGEAVTTANGFAPVPAMSDEEAARIQDRLREMVQTTPSNHPAREELLKVYVEVKDWRSQGRMASLPAAAQLASWGIWPPLDGLDGPALPEARTAQEVPPAGPPLDQPDDDPLRPLYEQARTALAEKRHHHARQLFAELRARAQGKLAAEVEKGYMDASSRLSEETARLTREAQTTARKSANNLERQRQAWQQVLVVNPDAEEAKRMLDGLAEAQAEREIEERLATAVAAAHSAAEGDQLPKLNELLGRVSTWKAQGERGALSQELYGRVVEAEQTLTRLRAETRERLGASTTILSAGLYKQAYIMAEEYFRRTVPVIIDSTGMFGPADAEVPTPTFRRKVKELFLPSLLELAGQRHTLAQGQMAADPEKALETVADGREMLTADFLTIADRRSLEKALEPLDELERDIRRTLEKFNQAKGLVVRARSGEVSRSEALRLLVEAQQLYPDYPNLPTYLEQARDDVAAVVAADVGNAILDAEIQMARDAFGEAMATLQAAQQSARSQVPMPKPDSPLADQLAELSRVARELTRAQGDYQRMMDALADVDAEIARFDAGGELGALRSAESLLGEFSDTERRHPEVRRRISRLADRKGDQGTWETGQDEYNRRNWQVAEPLLRKVANGTSIYKRDAAVLADRALACLYAQEASEAEQGSDWKTARDRYQGAWRLLQGVGTDRPTEEVAQACHAAEERLRPLQQNDEEVRALLREAREVHARATQRLAGRRHPLERVQPVPEYAQAVALLDQADAKQTTLRAEVGTLRQQVRAEWRATYLQGMQSARTQPDPTILRAGQALAEALEGAFLLYDDADQELAWKLRVACLDADCDQLRRESPPDWERIEENRKQRLTVPQARTPQVEQEYREAVRERILSKTYELQRDNRAQAKSYLVEQLKDPKLRADQELVTTLIELCWTLEDWTEADRLVGDLQRHLPDQGAVWRGLTDAARHYRKKDMARGDAALQVLRDRHRDNRGVIEVVDNKQAEFKQVVLDQLVREADAADIRGNDEGYLEAAEKYAQAAELQADDPRVTSGLANLGPMLEPGIRNRVALSKTISIGNWPLARAVEEIDKLYAVLTAIQKVFSRLQIQEETLAELREEVEQAVDKVKNKRERWKRAHDSLMQLEAEREKSLKEPTPITTREVSAWETDASGGWDFTTARSVLGELEAIANRDTELQQVVREAKARQEELENSAATLNEAVRAFLRPVEDEEFETIVTRADELGAAEYRANRQERWGGLDRLICITDPFTGREIDRLDQHKSIAMARRSNWEQWKQWSGQTKGSYDDASAIVGRLFERRGARNPKYSLEETANMCKECVGFCDEFDAHLARTPEVKPLSRKADEARQLVNAESWRNDVSGPNGYRVRAVKLLDEVEESQKSLDELLKRLRGIVDKQIAPFLNKNQRVPERNIKAAEEELRKCEVIDPNHSKVKEYQQLLERAHTANTQTSNKKGGWFGR
ncbi:MAG TPA: hypothetical protein VF707_05735 [Ardenticatenaceae bacterium]